MELKSSGHLVLLYAVELKLFAGQLECLFAVELKSSPGQLVLLYAVCCRAEVF